MAEVKEMTIPLRAAWNVPRTRRANRAITEVRRHVARHMKMDDDEDLWIDEASQSCHLGPWHATPS